MATIADSHPADASTRAYTEWHGLSLPITEKIHETIISLPISPVMTNAEVGEVIAAVNAYTDGAVDRK